MGQRLTRIATRTGDDGSTGLADGRRVPKHHPRIQALGEVDELNSFIGLLRAEALPGDIDALLAQIQQRLFDLGGALALPGRAILSDTAVLRIDEALEAFNARLPPLAEFILPGGARPAALAHVCRAVCRRAERALAALHQSEPLPGSANDALLRYLNRLSDLLFVLARALGQTQGETYWQSARLERPPH
ncbi:MAG: cob(I)yrinic acid a,c-diamide adenosyltransferase [Burkholderiaceae bacterium]|jgi:cob(I)alamin adenosyltransferase|nr:cob(I)yrinic acid a,c-diamide adenosyltransferase [Burkholderiaceae bacterium]